MKKYPKDDSSMNNKTGSVENSEMNGNTGDDPLKEIL